MSQNDLRVRRTRKFLRDAFMELLEEKGFEKVTVQDIASRAMVNRSTFYRHYQDKYDLALRLVDEMLAELIDENPPPPSSPEAVSFDRPLPSWVKLFTYVRENAVLYRLILAEGGVSAFREHFHTLTNDLIRGRVGELWQRSEQPRIPLDVIVGYSSSAFLGMLVWWLESDNSYTPEQMALWLQQLLLLGPYYGLGLALPSRPENSLPFS